MHPSGRRRGQSIFTYLHLEPDPEPTHDLTALDNATRPFVLALADKGFPRALVYDPHLRNGLNVHDGKVTCRAVPTPCGCPSPPR